MKKNVIPSKKNHFQNKINTHQIRQDISLRLGTSFKEFTIGQKTQPMQSDKTQCVKNPDNQFVLKSLDPQREKRLNLKNDVKVQIPKEYLPVYLEQYKNCPGKQFFGNKLDKKGIQDINHHKSLWQKQVENNKLWQIQINDQKKYRKGKGKGSLRSSKVVPQEIFQPIPAKKICQICRYEYEDYMLHLQEPNHKKTLKQTVGNYYIKNQVSMLEKNKKQIVNSQDFMDILAIKAIFSQARHKLKKSLISYCKQMEQIQPIVRNQYNQN